MALTAYILIFVFGICQCYEIENIKSNAGFEHGGLMIQRLVARHNYTTGLLYNKKKDFLIFIDPDKNLISKWDIKNGKTDTKHIHELGKEKIKFVTAYKNDGMEYIVASNDKLRFIIFDKDHNYKISGDIYQLEKPYSFAVGKCAKDGVLYALACSKNTSLEVKSKLYRISPMKPLKLVHNFTTYVRDFTFTEDSKGLFTIENDGMSIYHFNYSKEPGSISNKKKIFNMEDKNKCHGTMWSIEADAACNIWVLAKAELGKLFKINPSEKKIVANVILPMTHPTKLTFGGKDQKQLFIGSKNTKDCKGCTNLGGSIWGVSGFENKGSIDYPITD